MDNLFSISLEGLEFASRKQVGYARALEKELLPKYKWTSKTKLSRMSKGLIGSYITDLAIQKGNMIELDKILN